MVRIRILGPVELDVAGLPVALGPRRQRFVLGVLALEANRLVPVARLIALSWPQDPPRTAEHAIRVVVSQLRTILDRAGVDPDELRIATSGDGYVLHANERCIDAHLFRALADDARATSDATSRLKLFDEALGLWRGPVFAGAMPDDHRLAHGLDDARLAAIEDRLRTLLDLGQHRTVVDESPHLVDTYPSSEGLVATFMLALYRSGRTGDALAAYQRARTRLAHDLGIDPGPALQAMHTAILRNDPTLEAARTPRPAQLPRAITGFTGRRPALDELDHLAADGAIVAIVGPAGVGKTALGIQWAHAVRDRFDDGQLYVRLRGQTAPRPPIDALASLLRALDVAPERVPTDVDEAAALYRTVLADRRMLITLDDAATAAQVRPLLPGGAGTVVVITSRDRLSGLVANDGAVRVALDTLPADEAISLLSYAIGSDRVGREPSAADELAQRCGFLPLALRIAAANLADQPERSIAEHVQDLDRVGRLSALQAPGDEQAGVRAAFDASYQALTVALRRAFRLLSAVPGPDFTVASTAALADLDPADADQTLTALSTAHLVEDRSDGRFAMHDLLREYALDHATSEDSRETIRDATTRLGWYYLRATDAAAEVAYPHMQRVALAGAPVGSPGPTFADDASAVGWLDTERTNLVAVAQHASTESEPRIGWLLADHLRGYFWLQRHTVDWLSVADAGLAAARADHSMQGLAAAHINLGQASRWLARFDDAARHYGAARTAARDAGWTQGEATAVGSLANMYHDIGELHRSAEYHDEASALFRRLGNAAGEAVSLSNLGNVYFELGRLADAARVLRAAVQAYRDVGSRSGEAIALAGLGRVELAVGRPADAAQTLHGAAAIRHELNTAEGIADGLADLADVQRTIGNHAEAISLASTALEMTTEVVDHRIEANALNSLGFTFAELGDLAAAEEHHARARERADENDYRFGVAISLVGLSAAALGRGGLPDARRHADAGLVLARRQGFAVLEADALTALTRVELAVGDQSAARSNADRAREIYRQAGHSAGEADAARLIDQLGSPNG